MENSRLRTHNIFLKLKRIRASLTSNLSTREQRLLARNQRRAVILELGSLCKQSKPAVIELPDSASSASSAIEVKVKCSFVDMNGNVSQTQPCSVERPQPPQNHISFFATTIDHNQPSQSSIKIECATNDRTETNQNTIEPRRILRPRAKAHVKNLPSFRIKDEVAEYAQHIESAHKKSETNRKRKAACSIKTEIEKFSRTELFTVNLVVFAHVRGYRHWPATIRRIVSGKYEILFFGTYEYATLRADALYLFCDETVEVFGVTNNSNSKYSTQFRKAISEANERTAR